MNLQNGNLLNKIEMHLEIIAPNIGIIGSCLIIDARPNQVRVICDDYSFSKTIYTIEACKGIIAEPVEISKIKAQKL